MGLVAPQHLEILHVRKDFVMYLFHFPPLLLVCAENISTDFSDSSP